jgi:hypothetical protein
MPALLSFLLHIMSASYQAQLREAQRILAQAETKSAQLQEQIGVLAQQLSNERSNASLRVSRAEI